MLVVVKVKEGISQKQIRRLVQYSRTDPVIGKFTSDRRRFSDVNVFYKWFGKGRMIYTLCGRGDELLGIVWFGKKPLPKRKYDKRVKPERYRFTLAVRLYGKARGKGISGSFLEECMGLFKETAGYKKGRKGIWVVVSEDNAKAIKIYAENGFTKVTTPNTKGKIIMVEKNRLLD